MGFQRIHLPYLIHPLCKIANDSYASVILSFYFKNMDFLEYASKYDTAGLEQRSMKSHCKWIKKFPFNIIKINGNKSTEEVLEEIEKYL